MHLIFMKYENGLYDETYSGQTLSILGYFSVNFITYRGELSNEGGSPLIYNIYFEYDDE